MKRFLFWLKHYFALVISISLPILLAASLWITETLPKLKIPPPKYDLLYVMNRYPHEGVKFEVEKEKLKVWVIHNGKNQAFQKPRLFRYDVKNKMSKEITLPTIPPTILGGTQVLREELTIPETESMVIDPNEKAPDGYIVQMVNQTKEPNSIMNLFYERRNRNTFFITKDVKKIGVKFISGYSNIQVLGWILSE